MVNPYEIQKIINTKYKVDSDEIIRLNKLMANIANLKKNYDVDIIDLKGNALTKYQTEYNYNLYSTQYEILIIQKTVTDKAYHNKRLGFFRDMILAKDSGNLEDYQSIFYQAMDKLLEEVMNEARLSLELSRTIPLLHSYSLDYFLDLYKEIKLENIKLSMEPDLKIIQENYDFEFKKITDKANMLGSTDVQAGEILAQEKEKLDIKLTSSMNNAREKLSNLQKQQNNYKKSDMNIYRIREMIKEISIFFDKKETTLSSNSLKKFINLEKQFVNINIYLTNINDREIDLSKRKAEEAKKTIERYYKYFTSENEQDKTKEKNNLELKSNFYMSLRRGDVTIENFIEESGIKVLDDVLFKNNLDQTNENGRRIS